MRSRRVSRFGYDQEVMGSLLTGEVFVQKFPEIDTTKGGNGSATLQGTVLYVMSNFFSDDGS